MNGAFGVGCSLCAAGLVSDEVMRRRHALSAEYKHKGFSKQSASRSSAWAHYRVGRLFHSRQFAAAISMHEGTDIHKICSAVFTSPEAHWYWARSSYPAIAETASAVIKKDSAASGAPCRDSAPCGRGAASGAPRPAVALAAGSVMDPFRGRVPQLSDWLDVWAEATSCISLRKQVRAAGKQMLYKGPGRKSRRKVLRILSAVTREQVRKRLKECVSATEALDEWRGRKIIRIRCDTPEAPYTYDGVLGVARKVYDDVPHGVTAAVQEDHAEHGLRSLEKCHRRLFTPLGSDRSEPGKKFQFATTRNSVLFARWFAYLLRMVEPRSDARSSFQWRDTFLTRSWS